MSQIDKCPWCKRDLLDHTVPEFLDCLDSAEFVIIQPKEVLIKLLDNLSGRKGIGDEWDAIEEDIRVENNDRMARDNRGRMKPLPPDPKKLLIAAFKSNAEPLAADLLNELLENDYAVIKVGSIPSWMECIGSADHLHEVEDLSWQSNIFRMKKES